MLERSENILALVAIAALVFGCMLVLAPFMSALLWAVVMSFSTWGLYERILALVRNREHIAAGIMTVLLAAILLAPLVIVGVSLGENFDNLARAIQGWIGAGIPEPPAWLAGLPVVGEKLAAFWVGLAADSPKLIAYLQNLGAPFGRWLLGTGLAFGHGVLYLSLSVLTAYFLYRDGSAAAAQVRAGMERIAGARAHHLLAVAGNTVKTVVHGIIGAALAQGIMAGLGYWIAGVPGPFLLGLLTCVLALIPVGPPLIWIPASLWLFNEGHVGWGIFMLIWGAVGISGIDNIVKPYLISQGSRLPFILVFLGVLGGILTFGFIGVFLGPTLLAVGYALLRDWTRTQLSPPSASGEESSPVPEAPRPSAPPS
ncbi:MAG: AI-2E family transporter [Chromatiales bacterium]